MGNGSKQVRARRPVADGDPVSVAPDDGRGRPAIVALAALSAFLVMAALARALGVGLPFGDDDDAPAKNGSRAALPPEWTDVRPLRPLIPQREGSGGASADRRTAGRSREQARDQGRDAPPLARARRAARPPARQARTLPRSVPVTTAPRAPSPLRVVRRLPADRLLRLDSIIILPGGIGSIGLDLPGLTGFPFGSGGLDLGIDIDVDVSIPGVGLPGLPVLPRLPDVLDLPRLLGLTGVPGSALPDLSGLGGLLDRLGPTRRAASTGAPLPTGRVSARLTQTGDSPLVAIRLLGRASRQSGRRSASDDGRGSAGARERSDSSRARDAERRRPSEEAKRGDDRRGEGSRLPGRRSARQGALEALKDSPGTLPGGSLGGIGWVAGDCARGGCAPEDPRPDRPWESTGEEEDRGRQDADLQPEDDDPGSQPDGA